MKGMIDHREKAKELLEQLKNLNVGDLKENLKLQKEIEKIANLNDDDYSSRDLIKFMRHGEIILNAWDFIDNSGQHSFDSEIMSTPKSDVMKVFIKYEDTFSDEEYWTNLSSVYTMQDFMQLSYEYFKSLFNSTRSKKEFLMNEEERLSLAQLPETITIFRGGAVQEKETGYGVSWTLNKTIAQQFVDRKKYLVKDEMIVHELEIPKSKVVAYFNERNEEEIIYLGH